MGSAASYPSPSPPDIAAGVIDDARRRQSRRRILVTATVAVIAAASFIALDGGRLGPGVPDSVAGPVSKTVHAGPLTLTMPVAWQWRSLHGYYVHRGCTAPAFDLSIASYSQPALVVRQGGGPPIVIPPNQLQLEIAFAAIKASATPWKNWHLSNALLKPYHPVKDPVTGRDPNRVRGEAVLQAEYSPRAAIAAVALVGSNPMPTAVLGQADRVLHGIRIGHSSCR
jgi:hypothetical protein